MSRKRMADVSLVNVQASQLLIDTEEKLKMGLSNWEDYDISHSLNDYRQVNKESRVYINSIALNGSIQLCR